MTNEELNEAIRYLEEERLTVEAILYGENQDKFDNTIMLIDDAKFRLSRKPLTIYDMAIKAFEQQPCEDCISREAVIRLVEQYPNIIGSRCSGLIADIKHLPSVTPSIPDVENDFNLGYNCGYADAMCDIGGED